MAKTPKSFRFASALLESLQRRAQEAGTTVTSLAERYVEEGIRRDSHPLVTFREGAGGRRPALVGTRLDVGQVIETLRQSKNSTTEVAEWIERAHAIAEREEDAWRREQAILASPPS